jgi:KaiC/GvpD/RAD55 family RecA-like ATPase
MAGISLGYPLDLLLNRICKPEYFNFKHERNKDASEDSKGILLPTDKLVGTGNIIIKGMPGTGKSTLALQMAVSCTQFGNNYSSAYFSMEEQIDHVKNKAGLFGWDSCLTRMEKVNNLRESASKSEIGSFLEEVLYQNGSVKPTVLLPGLSPRNIFPSETGEKKLFWERYQQLESFLKACEWINQKSADQSDSKKKKPELRMVFIDSLNTFGDRMLDREEIFRIFDLFKLYKIIGVFILEVNDPATTQSINTPHQNTIEYMADTVISLQASDNYSYYSRYLEIEKSRYQHQIYGKHPYRIKGFEKSKNLNEKNDQPNFKLAYNIFPSLHYLVSVLKPSEIDSSLKNDKSYANKKPFDFGIDGIDRIIRKNLKQNSVLTIEGPKATFKSSMAENFLIRGLIKNESVLLIRLQDNLLFNSQKIRLNTGLLRNGTTKKKTSCSLFTPDNLKLKNNERLNLIHSALNHPPTKNKYYQEYQESVKINEQEIVFYSEKAGIKSCQIKPRFVELAFGEGMLHPEEFIQIIRDIFSIFQEQKTPITRVVLDDVSLIGISYPLLRESKTAGDLFLPLFVHLMRTFGVDLLLNGTTSDLSEANEFVNRACALSDTVISCRNCDIFGDRFVTVSGEGLVVKMSKEAGILEPVPGVIRIPGEGKIDEKDQPQSPFVLDLNFLQGLVGFETQNIHRPGLSLHLMEASEESKIYNNDVERLLQFALANPTPSNSERRRNSSQGADVSVVPFDTRIAEPMYGSFGLLQDAPIDRTVVCTLDEFLGNQLNNNKSLVKGKIEEESVFHKHVVNSGAPGKPYYGNVLLLAYRNDYLKLGQTSQTWSYINFKVNEMVENQPKHTAIDFDYCNDVIGFDFGDLSHETMSCIMLDALISGLKSTNLMPLTDNGTLILSDSFIENLKNLGDNDALIQELCSFSKVLKRRVAENQSNYSFLGQRMLELDISNRQQFTDISKRYRIPIKELLDRNNLLLDEIPETSGVSHEKQPGDIKRIKIPLKSSLRPDAGLYLCWYSQLRELINQFPDLAEKINVSPLPGSGVRGDWFLGIIKGSVSIPLGEKVIDMLCSPVEDFKRFSLGIGLPMHKAFSGKCFCAWPGGSHILLDELLHIHELATKRSQIPSYITIRHALANAQQELLKRKIVDHDPMKLFISELINQLDSFYVPKCSETRDD